MFQKLLKFTVLIIIVSVLLGSCQNQSSSTAPAKLEQQQILNTILQFIPIPSVPRDWSNRFSPDGNWYMKNDFYSPRYSGNVIIGFQGFFISNPQIGFTTPPFSNNIGEYRHLYAWSPDSSAFIVRAAPQIGQGCPYTQIVIYHYVKQHTLSEYVMDELEGGTCIQPSWSPDSGKIALTFGYNISNTIYLADKKGNLLETIPVEWDSAPTQYLKPPYWISNDSFMFVSEHRDNVGHNWFEQLHLINIETHAQTMLFSAEAGLEVIGHNIMMSQILVKETRPISDNSFQFHIYSLETNSIIKTIEVTGKFVHAKQSTSGDFVALEVRTEPSNDELLVFDWEQKELTNYGKVTGLVTWWPQSAGFLVVQQVNETEYYFDVIIP